MHYLNDFMLVLVYFMFILSVTAKAYSEKIPFVYKTNMISRFPLFIIMKCVD